ncbi:MAG TPA: fibronectin type III domain-containing protein [Acidimicrobiales bacterium]|nr:fibronectin type III domain-containing protein [Acidimicrobiales bacterium]
MTHHNDNRRWVAALLATVTVIAAPVAVRVAATGASARSTPTWTEQHPATSPPARTGASMAYDAATGTVVLFGGLDITENGLGDTWTWDGTDWTEQHPATSPPARTGAAMADDAAAGDLVLFGGAGTTVGTYRLLGDTWTWDGTDWTEQHPATSPAARADASIADDAATGTVVLFGGAGTTGKLGSAGGTWTWDGTDWTDQHPATSPDPRTAAPAAYDEATGSLVLFGGDNDDFEVVGDTWAWDGTDWTEQDPKTVPPPRADATMVDDVATGQLVLFGGYGTATGRQGPLDDTWTYVVPPAAPAAPGTPTAVPGDGQALVSWAAATTGGSPVTGYTVTSVPGGRTCSTAGELHCTVTGLANGTAYTFVVRATNAVGTGPTSGPSVPVTPAAFPGGYWAVAADGSIFPFGSARSYGSMGGQVLAAPVVGIAATPDGGGYWEVAADGGVFPFGDAAFSGSMGGRPLAAPVVGIAGTPDGHGYWEVAADGGIFAFGDAAFSGSVGGSPIVSPVVGIAATPTGGGYREATSDGGIFTFGDAQFYGSLGGRPLTAPVVGLATG